MAVVVEDDGSAALVVQAEGRQIRFHLTLDRLDELLLQFGAARADIAGHGPTSEFKAGLSISFVPEPSFFVQDLPEGSKGLALFHPLFGPVGLELSSTECARLARLLTIAAHPEPTKTAQ
ncbi:MAG: hypothetical protein ACRED8_01780 [Caulobacteraceae bacterium]